MLQYSAVSSSIQIHSSCTRVSIKVCKIPLQIGPRGFQNYKQINFVMSNCVQTGEIFAEFLLPTIFC